MSYRDQVLLHIHKVPALPGVACEAVRMLQDPDLDIEAVTRVLECDPGLTSNVLKLANSAYFGFRRRIGSVREAFVRLGSRNVLQCVLTSAVAPLAQGAVKGYDLPPGELWLHSVATAVGSVKLAMACNTARPNFLFTAGLLADIGKIVLGSFVAVDAEPITHLAFEQGLSFEAAERQVLGIDHAEAGALLLDAWRLPRELVQVARWHHEPERYPDSERVLVDLVHASDAICMMAGLGVGRDGLHYTLSDEVTEKLGLTEERVERVVGAIVADLEEIQGLFKVPA